MTKKLHTPEEEAERLGVSPKTLAKWRSTCNFDAPYIKVGRSVRYDPAQVDEWLDKRSKNVT